MGRQVIAHSLDSSGSMFEMMWIGPTLFVFFAAADFFRPVNFLSELAIRAKLAQVDFNLSDLRV